MDLAPDFDAFIGSLTAHGVEFIVVGAYGVPPVQIHVMSAISGVAWDEASSDRGEGSLGIHKVQFLGRDTFLRNKRAAGRPKDLADIDALESGRGV